MPSTTNVTLCDPTSTSPTNLSTSGLGLGCPVSTIINATVLVFDIEAVMGPRQDPHAVLVTIIYVGLLLTGIVGNVCTCIVIARNRYMHTATNYYLFSLAVSDLLFLVLGVPQETYQLWSKYPYVFGDAFCVARGWASEASTYASILTITAFTVERYLAICHPLRAHTMSRLSRAVKFIVATWICAALFAISMGYQFGVVYEPDPDRPGQWILETATCGLKRPLDHAFEVSIGVFFLFPATLLSVLYILIALQLRRSTGSVGRKHDGAAAAAAGGDTNGVKLQGKALNAHGRPQPTRKSSSASRKDVIKMLVAVVIAFYVCWAPFHAQRLMAIYISEPTEADYVAFAILTNISGVAYYTSATINPVLYSILSLKFRHAFRDTLARCVRRGGPGHQGRRRGTGTASFFNSTMRSAGYEFTDCTTVVSEVGEPVETQNGGNQPGRKATRLEQLVVVRNAELHGKHRDESNGRRKKVSSTISNASLKMVEDAFDDESIDHYIDQMKESTHA